MKTRQTLGPYFLLLCFSESSFHTKQALVPCDLQVSSTVPEHSPAASLSSEVQWSRSEQGGEGRELIKGRDVTKTEHLF
jgi:hypothetical protein